MPVCLLSVIPERSLNLKKHQIFNYARSLICHELRTDSTNCIDSGQNGSN